MIRFQPNTLLIYDPASQTASPLDQEALQSRLENAFAQCGKTDPLLLETLLETLLRRLDQPELPPPQTTMADLTRMLSQTLQDLGQPEVAQAFTCSHGNAECDSAVQTQPAHDAKLPSLLQETRYIATDSWNLALTPELQILIQKRVLSLQPLSELRRVVTVECRPSRLYDLPVSPRTELELHLLLPQLAQQTVDVIRMMQNAVLARWNLPAEHVAQIHVQEMNALVQVSCPSRTVKARQQFGEQLRAEFESALRQVATFPLFVDFCE
ncbi:MAG: hypothetical protein J5654_05705 [Victivallales bacterium]|nr:hypothetical protein [Victivallales bacterium]